MPNIQDFKGSFDDIARANRYRVSGFNAPNDLKYMARSASSPASTIGIAPAPYQGRVINLPGDRTYAEWTATLMYNQNDDDYAYFYNFHTALNDPVTNVALPTGNFADGSGKLPDGAIELLNRQGDTIRIWYIHGAIISDVSAIEFAADSNDTLAEFTITLTYDWHNSQRTSSGFGF